MRKHSDGVNIVWRGDGKISCEGKLLVIVRMCFLMNFSDINYITNEVLACDAQRMKELALEVFQQSPGSYICWQWLQEHVPLLRKPFLEPPWLSTVLIPTPISSEQSCFPRKDFRKWKEGRQG